MAFFDHSSKFLKIATVLLLLGAVFNIVAFSSNGWAQIRQKVGERFFEFGLWQWCDCMCGKPDSPPAGVLGDIGPFYKATQAMATIGFILIVAAFVLTLLSMIIYVLQSKMIVKLVITILCFSCFLFMSIGVIVYGAKMSQKINSVNGTLYAGNLNYSYGLAVVSTVLVLAASILSVIDMRVAPPP